MTEAAVACAFTLSIRPIGSSFRCADSIQLFTSDRRVPPICPAAAAAGVEVVEVVEVLGWVLVGTVLVEVVLAFLAAGAVVVVVLVLVPTCAFSACWARAICCSMAVMSFW